MNQYTSNEAFDWCIRKGVNTERSFVLRGDLTDTTDGTIMTEMLFLFRVKQPRIVDKQFKESGEMCAVLITTSHDLESELLPKVVAVRSNPERRWIIIWPEKDGSERAAEPLIVGDMSTPASGDPSATEREGSQTQGIEEKLGNQLEVIADKVVHQLERWHYEGSYRRLRLFSGIIPVPTGEEPYEAWREAAIQQSEEWHCPDHIKKQRIVESLRGPAMGIIQATRKSNPGAAVADYFQALDYTYGTLEDVGDLVARFHHTYQETGEKLSQYVYRLDKLIHKIVDKGGLAPAEVDSGRLKQLIRGALTTDPVAQRLRCTTLLLGSPTLNDLIKEITQEEALIANREKTHTKSVKMVVPSPEAQGSKEDKLVTLVVEQNKKIDQLILAINKRVEPSSITSSNSNRGFNSGRGNFRRGGNFINRGCFRCGQLGHRAMECSIEWGMNEVGTNVQSPPSPHQGNDGGRLAGPSPSPRN
ncbi:paraneoplastic antigen Ma1 homolog [Pseudophryne corroboree]|uniref:paraneoplastic antigen Ma1 homolog n=1 Tax=Pseudophryne corroboree TaxID=495146 RepID=UPI003081A7D9